MHSSTGTRLAFDTLPRVVRLFSEVKHGIKMIPIIMTHHSANPRLSHAQTCLRSRAAAALPRLLLQFNKHARKFSTVHHDYLIGSGLLTVQVNLSKLGWNICMGGERSWTPLRCPDPSDHRICVACRLLGFYNTPSISLPLGVAFLSFLVYP